MKIGVMPSSFKVPFKEAVILARDMGAKGLQPYVTGGELTPDLTKDERKSILKFVKDNGLEFSALCGDFGSAYFSAEDNEKEIQRMMSMMDLAVDFETSVVTTHIGKVPDNENDPKYLNTVKTIEKLGKYGESIGVVFATETGPEKAAVLKGMLEKASTVNAKVNLDPANFIMCAGQDPVEAVYILKDYIVHTHAKDGDNEGEKPLGQGAVPYIEYISALKDIGYNGFLTIERECGNTPINDIKLAYEFLDKILKKLY